MKRGRRLSFEDEDPLAGLANLFDIGIVFALGFMVSLVMYLGLPELLERKDMTLIKDPGTDQMEIILKQGDRIERLRATGGELRGNGGVRLGTAWRLDNGEVVYVPE